MQRKPEDWEHVLEQLLANDPAACLKLSRLVTGLLAGWRAYDFRDDWSDLVQEVLLAVVDGARKGRIRSGEATYSYIRSIARNKFADRLGRRVRRKENETLEWSEEIERVERSAPATAARADRVAEVRAALEHLPVETREIVFGVYGAGRTYEQVAADTGVPLGTVKRRLREGMTELRRLYATDTPEGGDPS